MLTQFHSTRTSSSQAALCNYHTCCKVAAVLYLGSICELATTDSLFANPQHPYTQALLSAAPDMHSEKSNHIHLNGEIPTPVNLPTGCYFHSRCPYTFERCKVEKPAIRQQPDGRLIACHKVT